MCFDKGFVLIVVYLILFFNVGAMALADILEVQVMLLEVYVDFLFVVIEDFERGVNVLYSQLELLKIVHVNFLVLVDLDNCNCFLNLFNISKNCFYIFIKFICFLLCSTIRVF